MFTCQNKESHLFVEISGAYSLEEFLSSIHKVAEHCEQENLKKVLINLRNVEGNPSVLDRHQIGLEIAEVWGPRYQVAAIAEAEKINRMGENTAVNRGGRLLVTHDENHAREWLGIRNR